MRGLALFDLDKTRSALSALFLFGVSPGAAMAAPLYLTETVYETTIGRPAWTTFADPQIANTGRIIFSDIQGPNEVTAGRIRSVDGTGVTTVYDSTTDIGRFLGGAVLSQNGQHVAFPVLVGGEEKLFRIRPDGFLVEVASERDVVVPGTTLGAFSCPRACDIDDQGTVVFSAPLRFGFGSLGDTLIAGDGGPLNLIASSTATMELFQDVSTNGAGFRIATTLTTPPPLALEQIVVTVDNATQPPFSLLDSTGGFRSFAEASITDNNLIVFRATEDNGVRSVFGGHPSALTRLADDTGPLEAFFAPSINSSGEAVFVARFDVGGRQIMNGPDVVNNRILGIGDVVDGRVIADVNLGPYNAINDDGVIAVAVEFWDGTDGVVRVTPFGNFLTDLKGQITTSAGGLGGLGTGIVLSDTLFDLSFDLDYLAGDSLIEVLIDDTLLGRFEASAGGRVAFQDLDPTLFGRPGETAELLFRLFGSGGTTVLIDNLRFFDRSGGTGGLLNGDFERGLEGWRLLSEDGGAATVIAVRTTPVPLPGSLPLLVLGLGLPILVGSRRRKTS